MEEIFFTRTQTFKKETHNKYSFKLLLHFFAIFSSSLTLFKQNLVEGKNSKKNTRYDYHERGGDNDSTVKRYSTKLLRPSSDCCDNRKFYEPNAMTTKVETN